MTKEGKYKRSIRLNGCLARLEALLLFVYPKPCHERNGYFEDLYFLLKLAKKGKYL